MVRPVVEHGGGKCYRLDSLSVHDADLHGAVEAEAWMKELEFERQPLPAPETLARLEPDIAVLVVAQLEQGRGDIDRAGVYGLEASIFAS